MVASGERESTGRKSSITVGRVNVGVVDKTKSIHSYFQLLSGNGSEGDASNSQIQDLSERLNRGNINSAK